MSDSPTHDASLKELAARLARGDEAAFAELYDACADRLHGYLAARARFAGRGERRVAERVPAGREEPAAVSRRGESGRVHVPDCAERSGAIVAKAARSSDTLADGAEPFTETNDSTDDAEAIAAAIARLDADDQELVELKIYAGLTFREIADDRRPPAGNRRHPLPPGTRIAPRLAHQTVSLT